MEPWAMPEPLLPIAITAKSKGGRGQIVAGAVRGLSLRTRRSGLRTMQRPTSSSSGAWAKPTPICCLTGCPAGTASPSRRSDCGCPLRETVAGKAAGLGRNVKQSGGHGEYAICHIEMEPLPSGGGFEFVDKIVAAWCQGSSSPRWRRASGLRWSRASIAGYPMVDVKVTLFDGKAHSGRLVRHGVPEGRPGRAA